jgi:antirestriction protein ArdC
MPANAATSRQYGGINVLILWGAVIERGFAGQNWLTFRQALALGGHVRKGEHGTTVVYADRFVPVDEKRRAHETGEEAQAVPFLKRFTVLSELVPRTDAAPEDGRGGGRPAAANLNDSLYESFDSDGGV